MLGRTILVTGGNRGIGLAIVKGLAQNLQDVILLGTRDLDNIKELGALEKNIVPVKLDLTSEKSLGQDLNHILSKYPSVSVLINNAGVLKEGNLDKSSLYDLEASLQVHVLAPSQLIKCLLPQMKKNHYGRIVNISSGWGAFSDGLTGPFSYSVSKAALNAMTLSLSHELPQNIKVNSMCPGWVKTRMGGEDAPRTPQRGAETALWLANLPDDGPSGKFFRDKKVIDW
jgi:NAD(P)-dependent dehydrogenase (short-subunit alcohol dehydrogenase family)